MIEDVYEPLSRYRDEFREKFSRLTREKFAALVADSGIDVAACRKQAGVVRRLMAEMESAKTKRLLLGFLLTLGYAGAIGLFVWAKTDATLPEETRWTAFGGAVAALVAAIALSVGFARMMAAVRKLAERIADERRKAYILMEPLNDAYTWDVTVKLIEATVPRLQFDPYFTAQRLADLRRLYGWDDRFNDGKSVHFAQSGVINGNPFLFGDYLEMTWGTETYTGALDIEWREEVRDADGEYRTVTRHETLHASLEKPIPRYSREKILIYGNDAAPNLSFSRRPSGLDDNDLFDGLRKRWRLWRLKSYSRNLKDDSDFTLMANHEFETWFHAKDRDHEVEFRLLFTALAQYQLMALMKDLKTGFGDDFAFTKKKKINFLRPRHLQKAILETDPRRFRQWNYDVAEANFQTFNETYFKDVYFALAPLLAIPLYQQTRTHEEIWKGVIDSEPASCWEHEAIANYYGEERFKHPQSITSNILKTRVVKREEGLSTVEVTAHGYRGVSRIDYVSVSGGDGRYHDVPVEWTEYLPISRISELHVSEGQAPIVPSICRRGIYSY